MKRIMAAVGLLLVLVLMSISNGVTCFTPDGQQVSLASLPGALTRAIYPEGEPFRIAVLPDVEEQSPAVVFGGGNYVLAFEQNGGIYVKVSSDGRNWPAHYPLASTDLDCRLPAVAYEAVSGWFIVTYACSSADIYVQIFSPVADIVPSILISDDASSSDSPAIACNESVGSCLVAFESNSGHIAGSYITIDHADNLDLSSIYALTDATEASDPRLAWGKGSGTYLLAYTAGGPGEAAAAYTHVHDDKDALTGNAYLHPSASAMPSGALPPGGETFATDAAFDPCTQHFLITLTHAVNGAGGNHDLWAAVLHATDALTLDPIPIAATLADARGGAIRFISAGQFTPACGGMDRLVVAYIHPERSMMAAELRGNSRPADPAYAISPPDQHLLVHLKPTNSAFARPVIANGMPGMPLLIAYERQFLDSGDIDIWGSLVVVLNQTFLPLVMR